jgi:hypothetical protein
MADPPPTKRTGRGSGDVFIISMTRSNMTFIFLRACVIFSVETSLARVGFPILILGSWATAMSVAVRTSPWNIFAFVVN